MNIIRDILNIKADSNQKWILISLLLSGFIGTYTNPAICKAIVTELPAEWLAFQSLVMAVCGLIIGAVWKGNIRKKILKWFLVFAIIESVCGCLLGFYLAFIHYNVWVFAICSLGYTAFISQMVMKCRMAFKAKLWTDHDREVYDNNHSIVAGVVCVAGFALALLVMPSLKVSLMLWGLCCILDDLGWIIVYCKNRKTLKDCENES